ncbi:MAG: hypothetical protein AAF438_14850, partial [Pseudomonadota bacterium]
SWEYQHVYNAFIAATMPVRQIAFDENVFTPNFNLLSPQKSANTNSCAQGWHESGNHPGYVEMWQMVHDTWYPNCESIMMFGGKITHIVQFR